MRKITLFWFLALFTCFTTANAQAYLGGEIQVSRLSDGEFEFNVQYLQNCVSCSEGANCDLPKYLYLHYGKRTLQLDLKQISVESTALNKCINCTRCTNDTCAVRYGISVYQLQAKAKLDSILDQNFCRIKAEIEAGLIDAQLSYIKASNNEILMQTEFDACADNRSPISSHFGDIVCLGRDTYFSATSFDKDSDEKDDITYTLIPISGKKGTVNYEDDFSYDQPLYHLGFPKKGSWPSGFHFVSNIAVFRFRPMSTGHALLRVKVEEYRAGQWLSTTHKDLYIDVVKCPSGSTPVLSGINCTKPSVENYKIDAYAGQPLCFNICTSDKDKNDSLKLFSNIGLEGASFKLLNETHKRLTGRFCWTPTVDHVREKPHIFSVTALDNGCQFPQSQQRMFAIRVLDIPRFDLATEVDNCGRGLIMVRDTGDVAVKQWVFRVAGQTMVSNAVAGDTIELSGLSSGVHPFSITVIGENGSTRVVRDSLISNGQPPFNTQFAQFDICKGDTAFFSADDYMGRGTSISWNQKDSMFHPQKDQRYLLDGTNGMCKQTLVIEVNVIDFSDTIIGRFLKGDAPHKVRFDLLNANDADTIILDVGDGSRPLTLLPWSFPYVHTYRQKGVFDVSYELRSGNPNCRMKKVFLPDYVNVFPTSLNEYAHIDVDIYPNPNPGSFKVESDVSIERFNVFDINGREVQAVRTDQQFFVLKNAQPGIYVLKLFLANGQVLREQLLLEP